MYIIFNEIAHFLISNVYLYLPIALAVFDCD